MAHALLAACNFTLWSIFVICDVLTLGYVSTGVYCVFAVRQLWAALSVHPTRSGWLGQPRRAGELKR